MTCEINFFHENAVTKVRYVGADDHYRTRQRSSDRQNSITYMHLTSVNNECGQTSVAANRVVASNSADEVGRNASRRPGLTPIQTSSPLRTVACVRRPRRLSGEMAINNHPFKVSARCGCTSVMNDSCSSLCQVMHRCLQVRSKFGSSIAEVNAARSDQPARISLDPKPRRVGLQPQDRSCQRTTIWPAG